MHVFEIVGIFCRLSCRTFAQLKQEFTNPNSDLKGEFSESKKDVLNLVLLFNYDNVKLVFFYEYLMN